VNGWADHKPALPGRQRRTAWRLGAGGGETLRVVELEVELGAEAPAGSPLTLSETGPL